MITPRSALKFDLFAEASRKRKIDEVGNPLQVIEQHMDFTALACLVDATIDRSSGHGWLLGKCHAWLLALEAHGRFPWEK